MLVLLAPGPLAASKDTGKGHDQRTFHIDGKVDYGKIADSNSADLVMYLTGNQFMVMEELIQDLQRKHPRIETVNERKK